MFTVVDPKGVEYNIKTDDLNLLSDEERCKFRNLVIIVDDEKYNTNFYNRKKSKLKIEAVLSNKWRLNKDNEDKVLKLFYNITNIYKSRNKTEHFKNAKLEYGGFDECNLQNNNFGDVAFNEWSIDGKITNNKFGDAKFNVVAFKYLQIENNDFSTAIMDCSIWKKNTCKQNLFKGIIVSRTIFEKTNYICCDFEEAQICDSKFRESEIQDCNFNNAELKNTKFTECTLKNIDFTQMKYDNVTFEDCQFENVKFTDQQKKDFGIK